MRDLDELTSIRLFPSLGLGVLSIVVYVDECLEGVMSEQTSNFLARDIDRRTLQQYNILKSNYYLGKSISTESKLLRNIITMNNVANN